MTTEELMHALRADLVPVARLAGSGKRLLRFGGAALAFVAVCLAIHGVRGDWRVLVGEASFVREQVAVLVVSGSSAYGVFALGAPGRRGARLIRALPALGLLLWGLLVLARHTGAEELGAPGLRCVERMLGLGLVPLVLLTAAARRDFPLEPRRVRVHALWSACTLGVFGTQWLCARSSALHVLVWHWGPAVLAGLCGLVLGTRGRPRRRASRTM